MRPLQGVISCGQLAEEPAEFGNGNDEPASDADSGYVATDDGVVRPLTGEIKETCGLGHRHHGAKAPIVREVDRSVTDTPFEVELWATVGLSNQVNRFHATFLTDVDDAIMAALGPSCPLPIPRRPAGNGPE